MTLRQRFAGQTTKAGRIKEKNWHIELKTFSFPNIPLINQGKPHTGEKTFTRKAPEEDLDAAECIRDPGHSDPHLSL